ncbi:hypothetical protein ACQY0O_000698 [Thecaphora frezii]
MRATLLAFTCLLSLTWGITAKAPESKTSVTIIADSAKCHFTSSSPVTTPEGCSYNDEFEEYRCEGVAKKTLCNYCQENEGYFFKSIAERYTFKPGNYNCNKPLEQEKQLEE